MNLDKKYRDKVLKIMELAIKKTIPNKRDVFVNFSAHVGTLSVSIYKDGWGLKKEAEKVKIELDKFWEKVRNGEIGGNND